MFTVGLTHATEAPLTINLGLDLGTAEAGDLGTLTVTYVDSNGATQTLTVDGDGNVTVPAGVTSLTVTVATTDDSVYEGDETFSLKVTEAGGVTTNGSTGVTGNATIVDDGSVTPPGGTPDDDRPTLSVTDAGEVSEGSNAVFTVGLTHATEAPLTINLGLDLGTAEAGDLGTLTVTYVDSNGATQTLTVDGDGNVTVPAGVTSLTVTVATTDDSVYEGDETFSLKVTEAGGVTTNGSTGVRGNATIVDDGSVTPPGGTPDDDRPTLSVTDAGEVSEGSNAVFTVGLTHATEAPLTINLGLDLGTAEAGDLGTLTVTYVDSNGATQTLTVDGDGNVTVPAGVASLTVTVATTDDSVYEGDETFSLKVTEAGGVTTNGSTGVTGNATIVDDGSVTPPGGTPDDDRPTLSVTDAGEVSEGSNAVFTVGLTHATEAPLTINLGLDLGTAEAGDLGTLTVTYVDSNGATQTLTVDGDGNVTVPAGVTSLTVTVATTDDSVYEGDETFSLKVTEAGGVTTNGSTGVTGNATIVDDGSVTPPGGTPDDDRPTLSVTDAGEVSEGSNAVFTVGLTHATEAPLTINLGLDLGTAEAGDLGTLTVTYVDSNGATQTLTVDGDGNVTVPAGVTSLTVTVATTDDSVYEGDETFSLKVTEAGGVTTNGSTGVRGNATIVDDGSVTPPGGTPDDDRPTLSVTDAGEVSEGSNAVFTVGLTHATEAPLTINLGLDLGTAEAGDLGTLTVTYVDSNGATQTLTVDGDGNVTVPAGVTSLTVTVATTDDSVYEGDETFSLKVTEAGGVTTNGSTGVTGNATIVDDGSVTPPGGTRDDDRPTLSVTDAGEVSEGSNAVFTVGLTHATEAPLTINLGLDLGTAEAGDLGTLTVTYVDSNGATQTLTVDGDGNVTVPAGVTSLTVTVATTDDSVYEGDETFSLKVTEAGGVTTNGSTGVTGNATIVDDGSVTPPGGTPDDDRPTLSVTDAGEVSEGSNAVFTVGLTHATEAPLTINLGLDLGTAEAGDLGTLTVTYVDSNGATQTLTVDSDGNVTVPAGVTSLTVTVATTDDSVYEGDETFSLKVTEAGGVTTNGSTGVTGNATIVDNDSLVALQDVVEGTLNNVLNVADGVAFTGATALGGTVSLVNGKYVYQAPVRDHADLVADTDSFTYTKADGSTVTYTINILDTNPLAANDSGSFAVGLNVQTAGSTSLLANDTVVDSSSANPAKVYSVTGLNGQAMVLDASGSVTVAGKYGDLTVSADGSYTYTSKLDTDVQAVEGGTAVKSAFAVYGFLNNSLPLNGTSLNLTGLTDSATALVDVRTSGNNAKPGIGVSQSGGGTNDIGSGESLVIGLKALSNFAQIGINELNSGQGSASWKAYDANGVLVGSGTLVSSSSNGGLQSFNISTSTPFQYLVLGYSGNQNGYVVDSIKYTPAIGAVTEEFTYTVKDNDGDVSDSAVLTLNGNVPTTVAPTMLMGVEDTDVTLTWASFGISDNASTVRISGNQDGTGTIRYLDASTNQYKELGKNETKTFTKADIDSGKVKFDPEDNVSGADVYGNDKGVGNKGHDLTSIKFDVLKGNQVIASDKSVVVDSDTTS